MKNIYVDCDEVLLNSAKTCADFLQDQYGVLVDKSKYPSDWDLSHSSFKDYHEAVCAFLKTDKFAQIPAMPEAIQGIQMLKEQGYLLSIVTSISNEKAVIKKREQNIRDLFGSIMFESITCLPMKIDNKGEYYSSVPTGLVVDDGLYNLLTAQKHGHEVILMATEQNPHMQQMAKKQKIPIHPSLISVAQYLKNRGR